MNNDQKRARKAARQERQQGLDARPTPIDGHWTPERIEEYEKAQKAAAARRAAWIERRRLELRARAGIHRSE